jgi:protein-S-isoprenylcysteine O-methyltransferase Ste14
MTKKRDTAGVIAPPPLLALAAVMFGWVLDRIAPLGWVAGISPFARYALAAVLIALAALVSLRAIRAFVRAGTKVEPWHPSTALVTDDIFARTRNPMYWGLGLVIAAIGFALASDWILIALVAYALAIHYGVVLREEKYLEAKFGDQYRRYKAAVPRYGWRL